VAYQKTAVHAEKRSITTAVNAAVAAATIIMNMNTEITRWFAILLW
jgi:hypothetical protein